VIGELFTPYPFTVPLATTTSHYLNVMLHSKADKYQHFGGTSALQVDGDSSRILYKTTWLHIPDLPPCNFYLFSPLKQALKDSRFLSDEYIKTTEMQWFHLRSYMQRDPLADVSMGYLPQCPW